jgi:hypothetical protein
MSKDTALFVSKSNPIALLLRALFPLSSPSVSPSSTLRSWKRKRLSTSLAQVKLADIFSFFARLVFDDTFGQGCQKRILALLDNIELQAYSETRRLSIAIFSEYDYQDSKSWNIGICNVV